MNYDSERAMNQKRLRMEGDGHGGVQGNGLPLNYMDNGHQIPYQPYAGAYNTHYPPPEAFPGYAPPPGGYAPQNLSYAPPAHQNYPHHQSFGHQQQAPLHIAQPHMGVLQGYGASAPDVPKWPPQHLLPPHDPHKDLKPSPKPEIKLEPDALRRHQQEALQGDMDQPKIKIKTDIFKPDDPIQRVDVDKDAALVKAAEIHKPMDTRPDESVKPESRLEDKSGEKVPDACKPDISAQSTGDASRVTEDNKEKSTPFPGGSDSEDASKVSNDSFGSERKSQATPSTPGQEPKKRGRPKGSTNKPKVPGTPILKPNTPNAPAALRVGGVSTPTQPHKMGVGRPRGQSYQYAVRPFRKDFSGVQFRRRWSDDCLDSSHIPNEVYFGDVPVSTEVLFNYYDAGAERERLAAQAAQLAAQKAAAAKMAAAKMAARGLLSNEVTTVDSSSDDSTSGSDDSDSSESDDDQPLKRPPGRPKGSKSSTPRAPRPPGAARRGRPPVPPELREPGITEMKRFCKAAGIRFDYKKLVEGCTKNKERVAKMVELLVGAGLEGKPTLDKCKALKQAKLDARESEKKRRQQAKRPKEEPGTPAETNVPRRMTRGQTGSKPRQKIVISSEEESDTPDARRTLSKLRQCAEDDSDDE